MVNHYWLPVVRAYLEIRGGDPAQAPKLLEDAIPYDLAFPSRNSAKVDFSTRLMYVDRRIWRCGRTSKPLPNFKSSSIIEPLSKTARWLP
jgi:hypothetical protein